MATTTKKTTTAKPAAKKTTAKPAAKKTTKCVRLEISSRKSEIPKEHFMQRWAQ